MNHLSLSLLYIVLLLSVLFQIALSAQCSIYQANCHICASNGCKWCAATQTCVDNVQYGDSDDCGCSKTNTGPNAGCSQIPCATLDTCYSCAINDCGWCEQTHTCVEKQPYLNATAGPCIDGQCDLNQCYKIQTGLDLFITKCTPIQSCGIYDDCFDCVTNGCLWCDSTLQCLASNREGTNTCGEKTCPNNEQCLKTRVSPVFYDAKCTAVNCTLNLNCGDCLEAGCGWCDSTQRCTPITNDHAGPCGAENACEDPDQCWKRVKLHDGVYADKCTFADCSTYDTTCKDCVSNGCGWCESTQTCMPISNDGSKFCGKGECDNLEKCFKSTFSDNFSESKCPANKCDFNDCFACVNSGCGWCSKTHQCLPSQVGHGGACGPEECNESSGCWKSRNSDDHSLYKCSAQLCEGIRDCATCTTAGCGWCAWTSTCSEAQVFVDGDGTATSPNSCKSGGGCTNPNTCWKTDHAIPSCNLQTSPCSTAYDCATCLQYGQCGWCASQQVCAELNIHGDGVCADCNGTVIVDKNDCVDCVKFKCHGNGVCNTTSLRCECYKNYYGPYCEIYCEANETCHGHGTCQKSNGLCNCTQDYYSPYCQFYCNRDVTCSGHGSCALEIGGIHCICDNQFISSDCSVCPPPYFGTTCDRCCDVAINCSSNGVCKNCTCECFSTYSGLNCEKFIGITPKEAYIITISLFVALIVLTIVTMIIIQRQIHPLDRDTFPQIIHLNVNVNRISIAVNVISYTQLFAFVLDVMRDTTSGSAKVVVLPFIFSNIPEVPFIVIFFAVLGVAVFWFLCMAWLLISARYESDLSTDVHAFFLDLVLTVILPLFGNALYLPILKEFFAAFACEYAPHSASMTLNVDVHITCWEKTHFLLMGAAFLGLLLYYPLALKALPLAQSMKEHYDSYLYHIVYLPKYLLFEAQIKLLITLTKTFFKNPWTRLTALGICMLALMGLQLYYRPCVSSPKVNLWRVVGYILIICAVGSAMLSLLLPHESLIPFLVLAASWIVVIFFAVFIYRAMFNSRVILDKYRSIRRRESERTPLLGKHRELRDDDSEHGVNIDSAMSEPTKVI